MPIVIEDSQPRRRRAPGVVPSRPGGPNRRIVRTLAFGALAILVGVRLSWVRGFWFVDSRDPDERRAISIAKQAVRTSDTWGSRALYEAEKRPKGWVVWVTRVEGISITLDPLVAAGGHRMIEIDKTGKVVSYHRGL